jgi:hypothetical protein
MLAFALLTVHMQAVCHPDPQHKQHHQPMNTTRAKTHPRGLTPGRENASQPPIPKTQYCTAQC